MKNLYKFVLNNIVMKKVKGSTYGTIYLWRMFRGNEENTG